MHSKPSLVELLGLGTKVVSFKVGQTEYAVYHYPGDGFQYAVEQTGTVASYLTLQDISDRMAEMQDGLQKLNHIARRIETSGSADVNS